MNKLQPIHYMIAIKGNAEKSLEYDARFNSFLTKEVSDVYQKPGFPPWTSIETTSTIKVVFWYDLSWVSGVEKRHFSNLEEVLKKCDANFFIFRLQ